MVLLYSGSDFSFTSKSEILKIPLLGKDKGIKKQASLDYINKHLR